MKRIKEKKERALGVKLFLKADRCNSPKCVMIRRPYRPGVHGEKRHSVSPYGEQLKEKQKMQVSYGLSDRNLAALFGRYTKNEILRRLETRLDRVVFLAGLAPSLRMARGIVSHGHIIVNKRKVTVSSYLVRKGDIIGIRAESASKKIFEDVREKWEKHNLPKWLKKEENKVSVVSIEAPSPDTAELPFDVSVVGEFYAR